MKLNEILKYRLKGVLSSSRPGQYSPSSWSILPSFFSSVNFEEIPGNSHWDSKGDFPEGLFHLTQQVGAEKDFTYFPGGSYDTHQIWDAMGT